MALFAMLAIGLGAMASRAEAAPFAYVVNVFSNNVSVIDTATNTVVATVPVGGGPQGVAVTPDGKHAYVANNYDSTVSVIDTATNTVVATVPLTVPLGFSSYPSGVAVTPDGKHAYVTNPVARIADPHHASTVAVIDTASNTVVATVPLKYEGGILGFSSYPLGVAVTPDGKYAYVASQLDYTVPVIDTGTNTVVATVSVGLPAGVAVTPDGRHVYVASINNDVSVIGTATNTVVATVPVGGGGSESVAVSPDGKHAYVVNFDSHNVSVIDTGTNTVVATVPGVGGSFGSNGVAVSPDGKHAYVANYYDSTVSVIDTATNTVVTTVPVGSAPFSVGIVPPPPGIPFLAFNAKLEIHFGHAPGKDAFELQSRFSLSSTASNGIHPDSEPVTLQIGSFTTTIPPGSFTKHGDGVFIFHGVINGVSLQALIKPTGTLRYAFQVTARGASLTGAQNPVHVTLIIGDDSGAAPVTAGISSTTSVRDQISH